MSGIHEIELSPLPLSRFCRHTARLLILKYPADRQKFVNSSLLRLEIAGNSL